MAAKSNSKLTIPVIGLLAVKNLFITKEILKDGLKQCVGAKNLDLALKEYFLSNDLISSQNIARLLRAAQTLELRQNELKFGAIAIRKGFINQSVLKLALEEQQIIMKTQKKICLVGDLLIDAGMLTKEQCDHILELQKRARQDFKDVFSKKLSGDLPGEETHVPPADKATESSHVSSPDSSPVSLDENTPETSHEKPTGITIETPGESPRENPMAGPDETGAETIAASEEDAPVPMESEIIAGGIKLEISNDYMAAFLSKTDSFDNTISLTQIKEALFEKGIVLGIVDDTMIEGFINSSGFKTKSFRVAKGISPIKGKDARVEFFFNTDYLKAGGLTNDGVIDFKDRGEIPNVEQGTVLAEKIAMVESRNGHNIFGDEIETASGTDLELKCEKGAKLSEDGFKVLADVKGFPKYSLSGHVFVYQEYITENDVDYETGHINFAGNVTIKGRIKAGFKVKGNDIQAIELDGGIVTAEGNINISGGINEGKIYARGNVTAKFIHNSEIICMGNVIVEKEIVDADIKCSGSCVIERGMLISSKISAKMGVKVKNIGTEMSARSVIKVGHDAFTEKELIRNREQIDKLKKLIEQLQEKKTKLKQENMDLQKEITELAHIQDRSQLEEKDINAKILAMEENDAAPALELKKKIEQLKLEAQTAEKNLDACFDKSENIEELINKSDTEIKSLEQKSVNFIDEKTNIMAWSDDNPGKPFVIVEGSIMPETLIIGKHSEKRVTEVLRHSKIMEILCTSEGGESLNIYDMHVGDI